MFVVKLVETYENYGSQNNGGEEESDGGGLGKYLNPGYFSFTSLWRNKRKMTMRTSWIPPDPIELIVFPPELLDSHVIVLPKGRKKRGRHPPFAVYKARPYMTAVTDDDDKDDQLHHVTLTLGSDRQLVSIFRSTTYQESLDLYQSCLACDQLFYILDESDEDSSVAIPRLLTQMIKHPLWEAVHIAAALGITPYFERMKKERFCGGLHQAARPEQIYPHLIAIENNNIQLTTMLVEMGADLSKTDATGNNAMHFAAITSPEMLDALWTFDSTHDLINKLNNDGYTPLLYSIRNANARCTAKLASFGAQLKLKGSGTGSHPLFTAMQSTWNCVDVLRALFDSSPELIDEIDPLTGNRAVHAALSKKPLTALLILKGGEIDLNARNASGQTALHVYAFKGDLGCVMSLASNNADLNAIDGNGDTPLHIAVSNANLPIVRALLCLGANVNIGNRAGDTPRHLAAKFMGQERLDLLNALDICGATRCPKWKTDCREGCAAISFEHQESSVISNANAYNSHKTSIDSFMGEDIVNCAAPEDKLEAMPATTEARVHDFVQKSCYSSVFEELMQEDANKKSKLINLLSLDGGGIRGLVIIQLLIAIENALQDNLFEYFDWIAGTSTGAILALGLAEGKSLRECQQIYLRFKDYIFDTWSRPYNTMALEAFMQKELGPETTLGDIEHPRLLITTVIGDVFPIKLKLLRNYDLPLCKEDKEALGFEEPKDWTVWKALRCSSAAPTFFCSVDGKYIDGGLIANNPLSDLLSEIHLYNAANRLNKSVEEPVRIGCALSIGTGIAPSRQGDSVDVNGALSNLFANILAMKNLGIILVDQVTATEGAPVDRSRSWCHSMGAPLYRLSAPMTNDVQMDEKTDSEIVQLMWDCVEYAHRHRDDIEELVELLRLSGKSEQRRHLFTDSSHD